MAAQLRLQYYEGAQPNKKRKITVNDQTSKEKRKQYEMVRERSFQERWQIGREWLKYDGSMKCQACAEFMLDKGQTFSNSSTVNWVEGTNNFKIDTVKVHERCSTHLLAMKAYINKKTPKESEGVRALKQLSAANLKLYRYKFRNAHAVAKHDMSFKDYVVLCELDRAKSFDAGTTYENDKSCREFIHHIALVESEHTTEVLREAKFFSITIDGATDVSGIEQESIFVHYCIKGRRASRFLKFTSPKSTTSEHIYEAVVSALEEHNIDVKKVVGTTTDGASNMIGVKKGFVTLMKKRSPDLISIHCLAHRVELSIKDAMKKTVKKNYDRLMTLLVSLYYFYKKSPKQRKLLQETYHMMKLPTVYPTRAGGTRWIPHTLKAISILMKCFHVITTQLQDASHTVPKAEGLAKLATDLNLFTFMLVLKEVLEPVSTLSMRLQDEGSTIADAFFLLEATKEMLQNYGNENSEELQEVCSSKSYKAVPLKGNNPTLSYRDLLVQAVLKSLEGRFSADREFFEAANIVNFVVWPPVQDRTQILAFGDKEVRFLQLHFSQRFQDINLLLQWRQLKTLIYQRYGTTVEALDWVIVNTAMKGQGVSDILELVDLVLSLPPTSVTNERSFSHMKLIKGEKRSRLSTSAMTETMIVKSLTPSVSNFNPDDAIASFLTKTPGERKPEYSRKPTKGKISLCASVDDTADGDRITEIELDDASDSDESMTEEEMNDVFINYEMELENLLSNILQLLLAVSAHKSQVLLYRLDVNLLGKHGLAKSTAQPDVGRLPSLTPLLMPRNQLRMSTPWLSRAERSDEMDEKKKLARSKSDLDEQYSDYLERAKTWHQITVVAQANESLSKFGRPKTSPSKVKVFPGSTASRERIPVNREPLLMIPEVDQRRDYAQYVLQQRMSNIDLRRKNEVMKLYLPYIQST